MKLTILGATGKTGEALVRQALVAGHQVKILVRNVAGVAQDHPGLKVIAGSVLNQADLELAMRGQDAVLSALGAREIRKVTIYSESIRNIVSALRGAGLKRFVCLTSAGVEERDPSFGFIYKYLVKGLFLRDVYRDMKRMEEFLQSVADLDWVCIRPTQLTDGPLTGVYRVSRRFCPKGNGPKISREDMAEFMLRQLSDAQFIRGTPTLAY